MPLTSCIWRWGYEINKERYACVHWYMGVFQKGRAMKKCCATCICSRVAYGFRTGWKYRYCMLDESCTWRGGKQVSDNHVCKHWRNTK